MELGIVHSAGKGQAEVTLLDSGACHSCGAKAICRPGEDGHRFLLVSDPIGVQPGEKVEVEEKGRITLTVSFLQFGLPLTGLFLGALIASAFAAPWGMAEELFQALSGFAGMGLAGMIGFQWAKRLANQGPLFTIVSRL